MRGARRLLFSPSNFHFMAKPTPQSTPPQAPAAPVSTTAVSIGGESIPWGFRDPGNEAAAAARHGIDDPKTAAPSSDGF